MQLVRHAFDERDLRWLVGELLAADLDCLRLMALLAAFTPIEDASETIRTARPVTGFMCFIYSYSSFEWLCDSGEAKTAAALYAFGYAIMS
jgi:hypothetical protein